MADRGDQCREGHNKSARAHSCLEFHTKKSGKNHQHHHPAACPHKPGAKADGNPEKQRDSNALPVQFFSFCRLLFAARIRLYQKTDADKKRKKQRETSEYNIPCQEGHIAADCTHGENTDQHDPASLQIDIFILCIGIGRNCRAENIR